MQCVAKMVWDSLLYGSQTLVLGRRAHPCQIFWVNSHYMNYSPLDYLQINYIQTSWKFGMVHTLSCGPLLVNPDLHIPECLLVDRKQLKGPELHAQQSKPKSGSPYHTVWNLTPPTRPRPPVTSPLISSRCCFSIWRQYNSHNYGSHCSR